MDDHHHCNRCFFSFCDFQKSSCPVVPCPNCGVRLHKCKLSEHTACICPDSPVPCINKQYGCDQMLRRSLLGAHLESCPASTVLCRFVRQRWQLDYNWSQSANRSLILADEKLLQQDIKVISNEKCIASQPEATREKGDKPFDAEKTSLWCTVGSEYFINPEKFCKVLTNSYRLTLSDYHLSQWYIYYRKDSSKLCHSFFCGAILRRDQFQSHAFNHQSLEVDFLSMKILRCPLLFLGCCFGVQTYEPSRGHIDYSTFMSCFTVSYKVNDTLQESLNAGYSTTIEQLPVELLYKIFGYLDSLSLWNLSQTNWVFRDVCETFLNTRGVIYFCWERNNDDRWHQSKKVSCILIYHIKVTLYFCRGGLFRKLFLPCYHGSL